MSNEVKKILSLLVDKTQSQEAVEAIARSLTSSGVIKPSPHLGGSVKERIKTELITSAVDEAKVLAAVRRSRVELSDIYYYRQSSLNKVIIFCLILVFVVSGILVIGSFFILDSPSENRTKVLSVICTTLPGFISATAFLIYRKERNSINEIEKAVVQVGKLEALFEMTKYIDNPQQITLAHQNIITQMDEKMKKIIKILFIAANPKDTAPLRLDEEIRGIDQALLQVKYRDKFDFEQKLATRVDDLQSHLLRYEPDVVHFSGHGSSASEIILEDRSGESKPVSVRALSQLFSVLKDNIRCVILNACYSEPQAKAIAEHIDCVIGMSNAIEDEAAIKFSAAFYQALGYGRNVKTAFELGRNQIDLELNDLDEQDKPKLIALKSKPEEIVLVTKD